MKLSNSLVEILVTIAVLLSFVLLGLGPMHPTWTTLLLSRITSISLGLAVLIVWDKVKKNLK